MMWVYEIFKLLYSVFIYIMHSIPKDFFSFGIFIHILHLAKCVFLCLYRFFNVHMVDSTVLCMLYPNSNGCFTHSFIPSFIHLFFLSWGLLLFIKCNISGSSCFTVVYLAAVHLFQHLSQPATVLLTSRLFLLLSQILVSLNLLLC